MDIKKSYGEAEALKIMADELWEKIDQSITSIATGGYGGLALAMMLSLKHNLRLIMVRDEPKKYGKGGWIDGYIPNEKDKVAIIDDVFTTGGSLRKMIGVVQPTGAEIIGCFVVVKRGEGELPCPLAYLLTAK